MEGLTNLAQKIKALQNETITVKQYFENKTENKMQVRYVIPSIRLHQDYSSKHFILKQKAGQKDVVITGTFKLTLVFIEKKLIV